MYVVTNGIDTGGLRRCRAGLVSEVVAFIALVRAVFSRGGCGVWSSSAFGAYVRVAAPMERTPVATGLIESAT